jgi:hypothetical protein
VRFAQAGEARIDVATTGEDAPLQALLARARIGGRAFEAFARVEDCAPGLVSLRIRLHEVAAVEADARASLRAAVEDLEARGEIPPGALRVLDAREVPDAEGSRPALPSRRATR